MGIARLLAKGWIVFCLFAGAHALRIALTSGLPLAASAFAIGICVLLFAAMGLLFAGGFGVAEGPLAGPLAGPCAGKARTPLLRRLKPHHLLPGFSESVFLAFLVLSFVNQTFFAASSLDVGFARALQSAIYFAVPGQRALVSALDVCSLDGGRIFAAAFTWLLAAIYLASAVSRLRLAAGIMRLERTARRAILGPTLRAFLLGLVAVVGIQFLFVGSAYPLLDCSAFTDITGSLLLGLAPLMLAYLIVAALASLISASPES